MDGHAFVQDLDAFLVERLAPIIGAGQVSLAGGAPGDATKLLYVALANEISVSELAAVWMPGTPEVDVKIAFACQAGDEARHFQLVAHRMAALDLDLDVFRPPAVNPLFDFLRGLSTTVERVAGGLFTLEALACAVNENFIAFCEQRGDAETVRLYREYIQPDEHRHQQLGRQLLSKYATDPASQQRAKVVVDKVLAIAAAERARAAERMGTACFPGC